MKLAPARTATVESLESRIAPAFSAVVDVSTLLGNNGFRINGEAASDHSGLTVSEAGDLNGDGFGDVIIGAPEADPHGRSSGAAYVVFGKSGGYNTDLDLSSLDGTNGFRIQGGATFDYAGWSVSAAGDVNGDGFADVIIGAIGNGSSNIPAGG